MSDEQIARLTLPELIELIKRLIEEVEINFLGMERIGQIMLNAVKAYVRGCNA